MYKDKTFILKKIKFFLDYFDQSKFPEKNNFFIYQLLQILLDILH